MLIGEYHHAIDSKKRLSLPAKFRKELGEKVIVTKGFEDCLVVYTPKEWEVTSNKLGNVSVSQFEVRSYARFTLGGATEAEIDKLGRILIPDYLIKYAGLKKIAVVCGLSTRMEIWDEEKWEDYRNKVENEIERFGEKLKEVGI
ncbi:MAG: division/cell wall cluster transcriptional repressor MraZ [Candidatus Nealsonbacteria bacterium]|nr:division/cell wall cluster transcriptional repressor MraZ [Candidatus Nealsonbacteria bacterium]